MLLSAASVLSAGAQTLTTVKSFGALSQASGIWPRSRLTQGPDGTLYGTTSGGEGSLGGTVFKLQPDGTGFAVVKWFTNSGEGSLPYGGVVSSGNTLYGTTHTGGAWTNGTVFKVNTDGTGFAVLKHFTADDGAEPTGSLALSGGTLYGTTSQGGAGTVGTVFSLNTDGTGFALVKDFPPDLNDGASPVAGVFVSGATLYGTTSQGGTGSAGTVFTVNTDGTGFAVLKAFSGGLGDGANPVGGVVVSGNTVYGTTQGGGSGYQGLVFQVNTDGTGYASLLDFGGSNGESPAGDLVLSGTTLFGTTQ